MKKGISAIFNALIIIKNVQLPWIVVFHNDCNYIEAGSEIELGDTSYIRNQGLIRVDPGFRCIGILLNHYCFIIIPITAKGIGEFFKLYKSTLSIQGEVNDYCFLQNSVIPTIALLSV